MSEMDRLEKMLIDAGVPHETVNREWFLPNKNPMDPIREVYVKQIWYPSIENPISDAICHYGSYGYEEGLLEIMGLGKSDGDVEGWMKAEDVFARWKEHYERSGK